MEQVFLFRSVPRLSHTIASTSAFGTKQTFADGGCQLKVIWNVGHTESNGGLFENDQINVSYFRLVRIDYKCLNMGGSTWGGGMVVEAITMLQAFSMPRGATLVGSNNPLLVNYKLSEEEAEVIEEAEVLEETEVLEEVEGILVGVATLVAVSMVVALADTVMGGD